MVHATATAGTAVVDDVEQDGSLHPGTAAASSTAEAKPAGNDFHPLAVVQSCADRLKDESRDTLTEHSSNLPTLFYIFSFSPPLPSPIRQPRAFFDHPIILYVFGVIFAIIAGFSGFPVFDLLYGRYWTNRITGGASPEQIRHASDFAGLMLFLTAVSCLIFTWLFQICFARASSQLTERMRHAYVAAVLSQDVAFFDKHGAGEVATFAGKEINTIRTAMGEKMGLTFMTATMMTASLIIGFCTSARVTGFLFAIVPVVVVGFGALGYASDVVAGPALRFEGRASTFLEEVLGSMRIVQSFDMASALLEKYNNDLLRKVERFAKHKAIIRALEAGLVYFAVFVTYSAAFWWVGHQLVRGHVSIGDGLTSFWNLLNSLFAFSMAVPQLAAIIEAITVIKTLRHTIERKPLIDVRNTSGLRIPSNEVQPSFRLDNVTLAYPSRPTIPSLKEVSLTLEAGKVTALVGPSGSGKSTITSLLLREYDPETANVPLPSDEIERITEQKEEEKRLKKEKKKKAQSDEKAAVETPRDDFDELMESGQMSASVEKEDKEFQASKDKPPVKGAGQVFYSDKDVRSLNIRWLRSQVAIVRQNPQLFSASVFENVAAGLSGTEWAYRPDIDEKTDERTKVIRDKVQRALEKAQAWSFVEKLPEGMDTLVSGGKTGILSGGQRQRLSLARALVRQPQVLVIDEGTSAIDTNTEEKIRLMLEREHDERGMTTVLIAHRLSTVEKADKIIVMRNGRVVDQGTHAQLMHRKRADQTYRQMVMQQREILQETGEEDERSDGLEEVTTQSDITKVVAAPSTIYPLHTVDEHQNEAPSRPNAKRRRASHLSESSSWQVGGREFAKASSQIELTAEAPATKVDLHKDAVQKAETEEAKSAATNAKASPSAPEEEKCTLSTKQLLRNFAHVLGLVKFEFTFGVIGAFIAGGLFPFMGWVTGKGVQALNEPTSELITSGTELWALVFFCVAIAAFILITLQSYLLEAASERLNRWLKSRALSSLMKQEIGFFDAQDSTSGALASSVSTYPASFSSATGLILSQVCISMANLLGSVILAFVLNAKTSLVVLAPVVLLLFSGWINIYMLEKYEATLLRPAAQGASFLAENVDAIKEIASLGRESETLRIFTYETQSRTPKQTRYLVLGAGGFAISQAVVFGTGALVFYYGGMLLSRGEANITAIYAIFEAAIIGIFAAGRIFQFTGDFGRSISAFKAMSVWFERRPRIATLPPIEGESSDSDDNEDIVFSDVELRYPRRPTYPAIRNLNLRIHANQHQAFCGTSGSGKSTILQMVQRFYDPYRGTIHMGATDVRRMDLQALRDRMSYVSQDACLYEGTIKFNLLLGARKGQTVTDAELEKACEDACIHDFIRGLPHGYDSEIGSKGTQLSGGQRQRICIARALIKRPQILLLDEATSALDAQAEVSVQKALDNASKGRTTLTVAHRLSTIRNADVIHVVEDGAIVESGSHDELIARRGRYLELVQAQL